MPKKPCLPSYQALSDAMMKMHLANVRAENAVNEAIEALDEAFKDLVADGVLQAEIYATGYLPLRKLALIHCEGRAAHHGMSKVLARLGYEYPVVSGGATQRGPGGGR